MGFSLAKPWKSLSEEVRHAILFGTGEQELVLRGRRNAVCDRRGTGCMILPRAGAQNDVYAFVDTTLRMTKASSARRSLCASQASVKSERTWRLC